MMVKKRTGNCLVNSIVLFVLILAFSIILFITDQVGYYSMLGISLFLVCTFSFRQFLKQAILLLSLLILSKVLLVLDLGLGGNALLGLIAIILKLFPIFSLGGILVQTSPLEMMASLRLLRVPNVFSLSIVTGLRFIAEMGERLKEIRNGMKIRGFRTSLFHPVQSFELYFVPLIYKCLHVSETLTSAIISKGAENEGEKTNYHKIKFGVSEIVFISLAIFLLWRSL